MGGKTRSMIRIEFRFHEPNQSQPHDTRTVEWPSVPRAGEQVVFVDIDPEAIWQVIRVRWYHGLREPIAEITLWRAAWQRKAPVTVPPEAEDVQRTTE